MKTKAKLLLFLCVVLVAAPVVLAQSGQARIKGNLILDYDLDATSYTYCAASTVAPLRGPAGVNIKTTGSSTSVTAVTASTNPFADVGVNDVLLVRRSDGTTDVRRVTARADADNVTVDSAVNWSATGGYAFNWYDITCGTASTNGWFATGTASAVEIEWHVKQLNVTGGIVARVECRNLSLGTVAIPAYPDPADSASVVECKSGTFTAVADCLLRIGGHYDQCRLGFKIGTADDGGDTGANAEQISAFYLLTIPGGAQ